MLTPFIKTSPSVGVSIVDKIYNKVVFPDPEAPMIPTNSPALISNETLLSHGNWFLL